MITRREKDRPDDEDAASDLRPRPAAGRLFDHDAEAVIQGPDATSLVQCGLHGQAYIAHGAIAGYLDGKHYLKIACTAGQRLHTPTAQPVRSATRPPGIAQASD
jgi:hypothetical protein